MLLLNRSFIHLLCSFVPNISLWKWFVNNLFQALQHLSAYALCCAKIIQFRNGRNPKRVHSSSCFTQSLRGSGSSHRFTLPLSLTVSSLIDQHRRAFGHSAHPRWSWQPERSRIDWWTAGVLQKSICSLLLTYTHFVCILLSIGDEIEVSEWNVRT